MNDELAHLHRLLSIYRTACVALMETCDSQAERLRHYERIHEESAVTVETELERLSGQRT